MSNFCQPIYSEISRLTTVEKKDNGDDYRLAENITATPVKQNYHQHQFELLALQLQEPRKLFQAIHTWMDFLPRVLQ